ncbi:ternary complex factor mip1-like [Hordeum vulgare]|nr:ternary complex factor mip1-like [Hordeum vulgare]
MKVGRGIVSCPGCVDMRVGRVISRRGRPVPQATTVRGAADWIICRQLTPAQVAAVQDTTSSRKQRLLGFRSFSVVPFDSTFRYLFLPDQH